MDKLNKGLLALILFSCVSIVSKASAQQYVQPERNDTIYMMPETPFDATAAKQSIALGKATIKGVAFIRPNNNIGFNIKTGKKILANKIKISLYPLTPHLEEFLDLKKKEKPKKLKFAFISPDALKYRLEAITNSAGEFTFPDMKPGKYYIEGILNWTESGTYQQYTGSGYGSYGTRADYYASKNYVNNNSELLTKIVEVKKDGEVVEIKLK